MKLFFAPAVLALNPYTGYELNEECPNVEGVDKCEADCVMIWQKCLQVCNNDYACVTTCNRQLNDCTESCPCHGDCYWGCPCDNPYCACKNRPTNVYVYNICKEIANSDYLYCSNQCTGDIDSECDLACVNQLMLDFQNCPCGVRCVDGCPCRNFDCDSNAPPSTTAGTGTTTHRTTPTTTTTAPPTVSTWPEDSDSIHMLIFNPLQSNSNVEPQASQIKFSWNLDDIPGELELIKELDFQTEGTFMTKRIGMCQYEFKGGMYLLGGESSLLGNRWYKVEDTRVIALPVLNFVLEKGSCTNVDDESVIACADFTENKGKACHRYDGSSWSAIGSTLDNHHFGGMARYNNKALIMGGTQDPNGSTEEYNLDSDHWSRKGKSPLLQKISAFSVVGFEDRVFLFGGAKGLQDSSKEVLTMDSTYEWTKFGEQLKQSRREHITLVKDNKLIHIGGREERYVEVWMKQSDGYFTQKLSDFQLTWWANFPNAFIIDETDYEEPE